MKAQMKVNARLIVEGEGETVADVFEKIANLAAVLGAADKCGCCGGTAIIPQVRDAQGYRYYELRCLNAACGAQFSFGQHKDTKGSLFPKRKDENGNLKPNAGWSIWQGAKQEPVGPIADNGKHPY
jgi:hypothetical protein